MATMAPARHPRQLGYQWLIRSALHLIFTALCFASTGVYAAEAGGNNKNKVVDTCIDVEVDGQRTLSIQCLNQQLRPPAASTQQPSPSLASEKVVSMPSNQLGLFNRAALINRMGSNFGRSAHPYRPVVRQPLPPLLQGRQNP